MSQNALVKFLRKKTVMGLGLAVLLLLFTNIGRILVQNWKIDAEIRNLEQQANELEMRRQDLKLLVEKLQSPDFIEREAREKLNLRKPGEKVVVVESEEPREELLPQITDVKSNPSKWWNYFFDERYEK